MSETTLRAALAALRVGRRKKQYLLRTSNLGTTTELEFGRARYVTKWVYEDVCEWRRECVRPYFFGCAEWGPLRWVCHKKRVRRTVTKAWTVRLRVPIDVRTDELPIVCTSDDAPYMTAPAMEYFKPRGQVFTIEPGDTTWWIVIGRDDAGNLTGQFAATTAAGRPVSGHVAAE